MNTPLKHQLDQSQKIMVKPNFTIIKRGVIAAETVPPDPPPEKSQTKNKYNKYEITKNKRPGILKTKKIRFNSHEENIPPAKYKSSSENSQESVSEKKTKPKKKPKSESESESENPPPKKSESETKSETISQSDSEYDNGTDEEYNMDLKLIKENDDDNGIYELDYTKLLKKPSSDIGLKLFNGEQIILEPNIAKIIDFSNFKSKYNPENNKINFGELDKYIFGLNIVLNISHKLELLRDILSPVSNRLLLLEIQKNNSEILASVSDYTYEPIPEFEIHHNLSGEDIFQNGDNITLKINITKNCQINPNNINFWIRKI